MRRRELKQGVRGGALTAVSVAAIAGPLAQSRGLPGARSPGLPGALVLTLALAWAGLMPGVATAQEVTPHTPPSAAPQAAEPPPVAQEAPPSGPPAAAHEAPPSEPPAAAHEQPARATAAYDEAGFLRATSGRALSLPADHGSHPATRTEWWYFTGPLTDEAGGRYGFQATWFRRALVREPAPRDSPLAVRDVLMFHGAITDLTTGQLLFSEAASRAWPPWAWASPEQLEVRVFEQVLRGKGDGAELSITVGDLSLELELDLAASPVVAHGAEPGLSVKGRELGQASWYYSLPRIPARGSLRRAGGPDLTVQGRAWMDHEFGSSQLGPEQVGWDWFSVALDDGAVLMVYVMRGVDGQPDVTSSGTLLVPGAEPVHLPREAFSARPLDTWTSPRTGISYPAGWEIDVPDAQLQLVVTPLLDDQELSTASTGVTYWEGLCRFEGERAGAPVEGQGYVELVGYGASIAERFAPDYR